MTSAAHIETAVREAIVDVLDIDPGSLTPALARGVIPQWDSLGHLRLVSEIESRLNVQFTMQQIADLGTLGDLVRTVAAMLGC